MPIIGSSASQSGRVPGVPTSISATAGNGQAVVSFTAPAFTGKGGTVTYTATSSPGNFTASGNSSPLTVTGLSNGTSYTFTVRASVNGVNGSVSGASAGVTPVNPPSVSGGALSSDATYYYRTFTGNGTLVVSNSSLTCDVLIGAGGFSGSGGGSFTSNYVATPGSYNFVIGASQNDSTGIGITAYAGGAPGATGTYLDNRNGGNGGSGGGAGASINYPGDGSFVGGSGGTATKASAGTILYGNNGGGGGPSGNARGGGGGWGGAGGSWFNDGNDYPGGGGGGTTAYNSWSTATGIGQLSGGLYYIGAGQGGGGGGGIGTGANTSGYNSSGFVMVRYTRSQVGG